MGLKFARGLVCWLLVCAAGAAVAQPVSSPPASATEYRPISFAKVGFRIPAGERWARLQYDDFPIGCRDMEILTWDGKGGAGFDNTSVEQTFREEMQKAGLRVSGDPSNLFEADDKSSDLQVGALVTAIDARFCATRGGLTLIERPMMVKGAATLKIEWQVYSTLAGRVIARIPTSGSYDMPKPLDAGNVVILREAFARNAQALAASDDFRTALSQPATSPVVAHAPLSFSAGSPAPRTLSDVGNSVALIFAGEGMGSAFLISPAGYLLTNRHVVGDASQVRVRWSDKSETVGQVIRSDRRRDVALIRVTVKSRPALALRTTDIHTGDTVFAVGTPLEKDFQGTVTKGVVSANRVLEGQSFIQSDVAVDHGNSGGPLLDEKGQVVGITQWGYAPDGVSHDLNFFIPIGDALRVLALKPSSAP